MTSMPCRLSGDNTPIRTHERASELAASVRGKVTTAACLHVPSSEPGKAPSRFTIYLSNWQTKRHVFLHYEEDLDAALEYLGPVDHSKPTAPPIDHTWRSFYMCP